MCGVTVLGPSFITASLQLFLWGSIVECLEHLVLSVRCFLAYCLLTPVMSHKDKKCKLIGEVIEWLCSFLACGDSFENALDRADRAANPLYWLLRNARIWTLTQSITALLTKKISVFAVSVQTQQNEQSKN